MRPLSGIKVIEFCQVLAGPFCGCLLADMGADVIKVEPPAGDLMRAWPPLVDGYSQYFASVNRNKRSVVLDLKTPDGLAHARQLALSGDVVIENFRPGVMARFGLDHASLMKVKPSLVYCSVSAYGQSGPRAKEGGFDMTLQAMSGAMSVTGDADGRPAKCGIPIADFTTGLYAAFSVVASLNKVARKLDAGNGDHIDVSMLGSMLGIAHLQTSELFGAGRDPARLGSAHPMNAPYAGFRCRDGDIALAAGTNKLWQAACAGIGRQDLTIDPRFTTPTLRAQHQNALRDLLEQTFAHFDAAQLLKIFRERGVPCAPINTYSQVLADAQVEHMQWVEPVTLPGKSPVASKTIISPQQVSGERLGVYRNPPALGAHTAEVIESLSLKSTTWNIMPNQNRFRHFIAEFTRLIERANNDEARLLVEGEKLLIDIVRNDDWLPDQYAQPHAQYYQQYLLYCDPLERFSVVSFVWGPGQKTPVHNHTVWGLLGVMRGAEFCKRFDVPRAGTPMHAHPQEKLDLHKIDRVSPSVGDIHEVANAYADRVSVSIHVYGANIGAVKRHVFDTATGATKDFVSGYSNTVLPNVWDRSAEVRATLAA